MNRVSELKEMWGQIIMFLCCTTSEFLVTGSLTKLILIIEPCEKNRIADHYDFANMSISHSIGGATLSPIMNE